ncbi:MAG: hypothetical protein K2J79_11220, partial [Ruminiclostridium sp.]|nr:hypothetical protein [Ruminiclostridium sp.]
LFILVFYGIVFLGPPAVAVWFVVSLVRFIKADRKNIIDYKKRRFSLIISAVLFSTAALSICSYIIFLSWAIPKM